MMELEQILSNPMIKSVLVFTFCTFLGEKKTRVMLSSFKESISEYFLDNEMYFVVILKSCLIEEN